MVRAVGERTTKFHIGCAVWLLVSGSLIYLDLGVIAFVGTALLVLWVYGLRDKFDSEQTASAYSVFNNEGKAIPGGFTANQFDQQMRGGGLGGGGDSGTTATGLAKVPQSKLLKVGEAEKLRRRQAAAAAADRRSSQQT